VSHLAALGEQHFWVASRGQLFDQLLDAHLPQGCRTLVDVGCGTGSFLSRFERRARRSIGVDRDADGLALTRRAAPGAVLVRADAHRLPLPGGTADTAVVLDVLEHTDDRAVLTEVARVLRPGGMALVSVPTMPWLWSGRDVGAGHLRRYAPRRLVRLVTELGLRVERVRHFQFLLSPLFVASRLMSRRHREAIALEDHPGPRVNRVLAAVNRVEVALGRLVPWPWGSSVVVVCRRP